MAESNDYIRVLVQGKVLKIVTEAGVDMTRKAAYGVGMGLNEKSQKAISDSIAEPVYDMDSSNPARASRGSLQSGFVVNADGQEIVIGGDLTLIDSNEATNRLELGEAYTLTTSRTKRIVQTAINGQTGSVKEWITDGDVVVNLRIEIAVEGDFYPKDKLKEIMNFLSLNRNLLLENYFFNDVLKLTRVVVTGWNHKPETWSNGQSIDVDLLQDDTYLIEEKIIK
jgi:hypothetical protein